MIDFLIVVYRFPISLTTITHSESLHHLDLDLSIHFDYFYQLIKPNHKNQRII